jgi:GNAT superfamily N-acetyltransferase
LCSHDQPADMKDRLRRKGFETGEAEFILVFDLEQAPERILEPKHIPGDEQGALKIERVHNNPGLQAVQELEETVWDEQMSWLFDDLSGLLRDAPNFVSIYLAYLHDKPVSAAWSFYPPGSQFVDLYGGATLEALRGKGLYTTLLAHRAQEAVQRGRRYLIVDAGEMSRPILIKRGFQVLVTFYTCEWKINM